MSIETLIDTTKPCPARIYDYWLGGKHNFPVDRAVGKQMEKSLPFVMQALNLNRWFVEHAGKTMTKQGVTNFLDLGAGLPTEGALHTTVPATSKVLYVDHDPDAVTYAQHIIQDELGSPANISFIQGRIEEVEPILAQAAQFFDRGGPVGICLIGVTWFLDDAALKQALHTLGPGPPAQTPPGPPLPKRDRDAGVAVRPQR